MTALLVGDLKVEILGVVGSDQLAVRPLLFSQHYQRLQEKLQREGNELKILSLPSVNQSCAVLSGSSKLGPQIICGRDVDRAEVE